MQRSQPNPTHQTARSALLRDLTRFGELLSKFGHRARGLRIVHKRRDDLVHLIEPERETEARGRLRNHSNDRKRRWRHRSASNTRSRGYRHNSRSPRWEPPMDVHWQVSASVGITCLPSATPTPRAALTSAVVNREQASPEGIAATAIKGRAAHRPNARLVRLSTAPSAEIAFIRTNSLVDERAIPPQIPAIMDSYAQSHSCR